MCSFPTFSPNIMPPFLHVTVVIVHPLLHILFSSHAPNTLANHLHFLALCTPEKNLGCDLYLHVHPPISMLFVSPLCEFLKCVVTEVVHYVIGFPVSKSEQPIFWITWQSFLECIIWDLDFYGIYCNDIMNIVMGKQKQKIDLQFQLAVCRRD